MIQINQAKLLRQIQQNVTQVIRRCVDEGVEAGKDAAHVLTGRNRESIRQEDPETNGNVVTLRVKVGGIELYGVEFEQGILAPVDYSLEEEIRHPVIGSSVVPAIAKAVEKLKPL